MDIAHGIGGMLQAFGIFGGIAMVVLASAKAKLDHRKLDITRGQPTIAPQNDVVLTELQALKRQIGEMQATGHQFDISFDAALSRLEERVNRVETKVATAPLGSQAEETQRVGLR
jgi:hypothetical protein